MALLQAEHHVSWMEAATAVKTVISYNGLKCLEGLGFKSAKVCR